LSKIQRDFKQRQTLIANISGTDGDIENRKVTNYQPSLLGDTNWVNFGTPAKKV